MHFELCRILLPVQSYGRSPFRGQNARNPDDKNMSHFAFLETVLRVLESESEESKSYRYNFEEFVLENSKNRFGQVFFECSLPMNSICRDIRRVCLRI